MMGLATSRRSYGAAPFIRPDRAIGRHGDAGVEPRRIHPAGQRAPLIGIWRIVDAK